MADRQIDAFILFNEHESAVREVVNELEMVSYILERLAAKVSPAETQEQEEAVLTAELSSAKVIVEEARGEKKLAQELIQNGAAELQKA